MEKGKQLTGTLLLVVSLIYSMGCSAQYLYTSVKEAQRMALKEHKLLFIYNGSEAYTYSQSKTLIRNFFASDSLNVPVGKIIDKDFIVCLPRGKEVFNEQGIHHFPAYLVLDGNGVLITKEDADINPNIFYKFQVYSTDITYFKSEVFMAQNKLLSPYRSNTNIYKKYMNNVNKIVSRASYFDVDRYISLPDLVQQYSNYITTQHVSATSPDSLFTRSLLHLLEGVQYYVDYDSLQVLFDSAGRPLPAMRYLIDAYPYLSKEMQTTCFSDVEGAYLLTLFYSLQQNDKKAYTKYALNYESTFPQWGSNIPLAIANYINLYALMSKDQPNANYYPALKRTMNNFPDALMNENHADSVEYLLDFTWTKFDRIRTVNVPAKKRTELLNYVAQQAQAINKNTMKNTHDFFLFVGSYTSKDDSAAHGIHVFKFNEETGKASLLSRVSVKNASYLALSKDLKSVYAVSENGDTKSCVNAFSFDKSTAHLHLINKQSTDADPCYLSFNETAQQVVVGNYSGGSIQVYKTRKDGSLDTASQHLRFEGHGVDPIRQASAHTHCVYFSPDGKYLFANDLGMDLIRRFNLNTSSGDFIIRDSEKDFKLPKGEGPRHLVFHPNGKYVYLITELGGKVFAFHYNHGDLNQFQSIVADSTHAQGSADIHISPNGKFLYISNRLKEDRLVIFSIDPASGTLKLVGSQTTGIHPRNFMITSNGKFLLVAARDNNFIQVFSMDQQTGLLTNTHQDISVGLPVCLKEGGPIHP